VSQDRPRVPCRSKLRSFSQNFFTRFSQCCISKDALNSLEMSNMNANNTQCMPLTQFKSSCRVYMLSEYVCLVFRSHAMVFHVNALVTTVCSNLCDVKFKYAA
jgi:hypothetical protein